MKIGDYRRLCQKNAEENYLLDKYLFRKISIYLTVLLIKLHVTPNQATFFSLLCALSGTFLLAYNDTGKLLAAVALIFCYYLLDHADGELARYYLACGRLQPSLAGRFFDLLVHKYSTNLMLFALGVSVYRRFHYPAAVVLGFSACIAYSAFPNLLAAQVVVQKIAGDTQAAAIPAATAILQLLDKKRQQLAAMKERSLLPKLKKLLAELLFFPGSLLAVMLVSLADIFFPPFSLFGVACNVRLLFLILATPLYLLNTVRQTLKWYGLFTHLA